MIDNALRAERLAGLCRLVLDLRLLAVFLTLVTLPRNGGGLAWLVLGLMVPALASYVPLRRWERVAPMLLRHPSFLAADLVVALVVLAVVGPESPFLYYAVATAGLGGALYGTPGAVLFSSLLLGGHLWLVDLRATVAGTPEVQVVLVSVLLYPLAGAAGVALRRLLDRQATTHTARATADERARLARDMHDSLAKTLLGISMTASALPRKVDGDRDAARIEARLLAQAAQEAAEQARQILVGLRCDRPDQPLGPALARWAARWAESTGVGVDTLVDESVQLDPAARYELFSVAQEALCNVGRHAAATHVRVTVRTEGPGVVLTVSDDGVGLPADATRAAFERRGRFGVIGMAERVERLGGRFAITPSDGGGVTVIAGIPSHRSLEGVTS